MKSCPLFEANSQQWDPKVIYINRPSKTSSTKEDLPLDPERENIKQESREAREALKVEIAHAEIIRQIDELVKAVQSNNHERIVRIYEDLLNYLNENQEFLENSPMTAQAHINGAIGYRGLGNVEKVLEALNAANGIEPENTDVNNWIDEINRDYSLLNLVFNKNVSIVPKEHFLDRNKTAALEFFKNNGGQGYLAKGLYIYNDEVYFTVPTTLNRKQLEKEAKRYKGAQANRERLSENPDEKAQLNAEIDRLFMNMESLIERAEGLDGNPDANPETNPWEAVNNKYVQILAIINQGGMPTVENGELKIHQNGARAARALGNIQEAELREGRAAKVEAN